MQLLWTFLIFQAEWFSLPVSNHWNRWDKVESGSQPSLEASCVGQRRDTQLKRNTVVPPSSCQMALDSHMPIVGLSFSKIMDFAPTRDWGMTGKGNQRVGAWYLLLGRYGVHKLLE